MPENNDYSLYQNEVPQEQKASSLEDLAKLATKQLNLESTLSELDQRVKKVKEELKQVQEHDIPNLMEALGVAKYTFSNGSELKVTDIIAASIGKKNQEKAFEWLRENGHGDIIKNEISVKLASGMDQDAEKVEESIKQLGLIPERSENVHHSTLKAFAKERIQEGHALPDCFTVYVGRKAVIK